MKHNSRTSFYDKRKHMYYDTSLTRNYSFFCSEMDVSQAYLLLLLILACWRGCVSQVLFQHGSKFHAHFIHMRYCKILNSACNVSKFLTFWELTRSCVALRAADLDWIVGLGYSWGRYISWRSQRLALCLWHSARIGAGSQLTSVQE